MKLTIAGIGPGDPQYLTTRCREHLKTAGCVIGATRQIKSMQHLFAPASDISSYTGSIKELLTLIENARLHHEHLTVLASGDPNFYGITSYLKKHVQNADIEVLSGISSLQYFFNKIGIPMHDCYLTSAHGRHFDKEHLTAHSRIGILTDKVWTPQAIAKAVIESGRDPLMAIGENLSYDDECITVVRASKIPDKPYTMNVVVIDYER